MCIDDSKNGLGRLGGKLEVGVVRHLVTNWNSTLSYLEEVRETVNQLR